MDILEVLFRLPGSEPAVLEPISAPSALALARLFRLFLSTFLGESGTRRPRAGEWFPDERAGWVLFGVPDHTANLAPRRGAPHTTTTECALRGSVLG